MSSYDEGSENDTEQIYRPSNYYTDCLDMPVDYRPKCVICKNHLRNNESFYCKRCINSNV